MSLPEAVIRAQQKLSEQYGIPTFDLTGNISTVPTTRNLSNINVGVGKYTGETVTSLQNKLQNLITQVRATGGQIGNTLFQAPAQTSPTSQAPNGNTQPSGPSDIPLTDQFLGSLEKIKGFVGPTGLLLGGALLVLVVVTRNRGG